MSSFFKFYKDDFPSFHLISQELELWERFWLMKKGNCPSKVTGTLNVVDFKGFPNIKFALRILATIPITSCECECSVSCLRRLKSYTRPEMSNDRWNSLALQLFHLKRIPDTERVINEFAGIKPRRFEFDL